MYIHGFLACMCVYHVHGWHLWRSEHLSKALELALQMIENHMWVPGMKTKSSARIASVRDSGIASPAPFIFIFKQWNNQKEQIWEVCTSCT